jgi:hypothetical protein
MYNHIIGIYDELWDIVEDGTEVEVDEEGMERDKKSLTEV